MKYYELWHNDTANIVGDAETLPELAQMIYGMGQANPDLPFELSIIEREDEAVNSIKYIDNILVLLDAEHLADEPDKRPFAAFKLHLRTLRSIVVSEFTEIEANLTEILDEIKKISQEAKKVKDD